MSSDSNLNIVSRRNKPPLVAEGVRGPLRGSRRGDLINQPAFTDKMWTMADEGSYFYSQHPVIDAATTIAGHAAPVLADLYTKPFLIVKNASASSEDKRVYLDFILITVITPGTGGTSDNWAAECDTGVDRSSTVGTALTTVNPNMQSTAGPSAAIKCGPLVASAATTAQRKVGSGVFRPAIAVAGDQYLFQFGGNASSLGAAVATALSRHVIPMPPVILGANDQFLLHLYAPSQSAAGVYKVQMGHVER
jgi:hypothetical protein